MLTGGAVLSGSASLRSRPRVHRPALFLAMRACEEHRFDVPTAVDTFVRGRGFSARWDGRELRNSTCGPRFETGG
ncbi:hypothetical protein BKA80DRAFT_258754 [Phyllosticta citrichinensis]